MTRTAAPAAWEAEMQALEDRVIELTNALRDMTVRAERAEREVEAARFDRDESHRSLSARLFKALEQVRGMQQQHDHDCAWISELSAQLDQPA